MPYVRTWDENAPAGTQDASLIDDDFRNLKVDLRERLNTVLGVAIGTALADPLIAVASSLTTLRSHLTAVEGGVAGDNLLWAVQTKKLFIPWADAFIAVAASTVPNPGRTAAGITITEATHTRGDFYWAIILPVGVTITACGININGSGNTTTVYDLYKRAKTATSLTSIAAYSATDATGIRTSSPAGFSEVTVTDTYYSIQASITPQAGNTTIVYGIEITYTTPNANIRI